eukprot:7817536-Karenia_brevis.AAC.1
MPMLEIINAWDEDVGREWIKSLWDLRHAPHPWTGVKGPMGATQMHLMEIRWDMQRWQGQIRLQDHRGDVWQPNP